MKTYNVNYIHYIDEAPGGYEGNILVRANNAEDALSEAFETFLERFGSYVDYAVNEITEI